MSLLRSYSLLRSRIIGFVLSPSPTTVRTVIIRSVSSSSSPFTPPTIVSLEKDLRKLRERLKVAKEEHGFPRRPATAAALYVKFRLGQTAIAPGLGSSVGRPKMPDLYKEWHKEWAGMSEVSKMRFVEEAGRNKARYDEEVVRWDEAQANSELPDIIMGYEEEIRFLKSRLSMAKQDVESAKIEEGRRRR